MALSITDKVDKVAGGALAFVFDFDCFVALGVEVLDALIEADTEVIGGEAQNFADR